MAGEKGSLNPGMNEPASPPFPIEDGPWRMAMALRPLAPSEWIASDGNLEEQLAEKDRLLAVRRGEVFASLPGSEAAQPMAVAFCLLGMAILTTVHVDMDMVTSGTTTRDYLWHGVMVGFFLFQLPFSLLPFRPIAR